MTSRSSTESVPRVSVIMAVYNAERYLAEAIESVLAQTFADFECLIHDDGSSDGSLAMLQDYAARDDRIVLSSGPNKGLAAALNRLIESARGEFLARMDADDISRPDRFACQVAYLDDHPDIAVLGAFARFIDEHGRPIRDMDHPVSHDEIDARNLEGGTALFHPTVMMRRDAVQTVGGYDPSFRKAEDLDLWLRVAEKFPLANYPAVLIDYRFHSFSMSADRDADTASNLRARQLAADRRNLPEPVPIEPWRPGLDRESQRELALQWAWQAWNCGYRDTWRHYTLRSIADAPLSVEAWKLLIAGAIKRPRSKGE